MSDDGEPKDSDNIYFVDLGALTDLTGTGNSASFRVESLSGPDQLQTPLNLLTASREAAMRKLLQVAKLNLNKPSRS